jgi:hypothetical protein
MQMVKVIVAKDKIDCEHLLGTYVDESHYDILVEEDTDCYMPATCNLLERSNCNDDCSTCEKGTDERRIAFKFRKNYFSEEEQKMAYEGLVKAATGSQNRGIAAGPRGGRLALDETGVGRDWVTPYQQEVLSFLLDESGKLFEDNNLESIKEKYKNPKYSAEDEVRGTVWLRSKVEEEYPDYNGWFDLWVAGLSNKPPEMIKEEAHKIAYEWISTTNYARTVFSGVAGWFDRYPRIPYGRPTSYTEKHFDLFKKSYPFLQTLNNGFKELMPWRWSNQKAAVDKIDSKFVVPETVFTTITVNKGFRTACHRDAGDLDEGLSNLLVLAKGDFEGGYLVFPEYRVAVNPRPGDLLLVNNHEIIHGNTEIKPKDKNSHRISLVCYFREKMLDLKSYEYESLRRQYVDERRLNKDHKLWKPLWNGVSPNMWYEEEWYDYLRKHNIPNPYEVEKSASLDNFF